MIPNFNITGVRTVVYRIRRYYCGRFKDTFEVTSVSCVSLRVMMGLLCQGSSESRYAKENIFANNRRPFVFLFIPNPFLRYIELDTVSCRNKYFVTCHGPSARWVKSFNYIKKTEFCSSHLSELIKARNHKYFMVSCLFSETLLKHYINLLKLFISKVSSKLYFMFLSSLTLLIQFNN